MIRPKLCSVTNQTKKHTILRPVNDGNFCIDSETDFRTETDAQSDIKKYSFRTFSWSGIDKEELSIDCEIEVSIEPFLDSKFEIC